MQPLVLKMVYTRQYSIWPPVFMVSTYLLGHVSWWFAILGLEPATLPQNTTLVLSPLPGIGTSSMLFGYFCLSVFIGGEARTSSCITSTARFYSSATRLVNFIYRTKPLPR